MPVSESEVLGVSVFRCHFNEKAEHVPIKKRKFMFRSPSPPSRALSSHREDTQRLLKCQSEAVGCVASASDSVQIVDIERDADEKNFVRLNKQLDQNEDFSGISILAAAACSNSFEGGDNNVDEGSRVEESFVHEGPIMNSESCSLVQRVSKEDFGSAEISTEGRTGSSISAVPAEKFAVPLTTENSLTNSVLQANNEQDTSVQYCSTSISEELLTKIDESTENRLHWDLNTSMDAWGCHSDYQTTVSGTNVAVVIPEDKHGDCGDKMGSFDREAVQMEAGVSTCHGEKELPPADSSGIDHKESIDELRLDLSTDAVRACCIPEKFSSGGYVDFVSADIASAPTDGDRSASAHCLTFGSVGNSESLSSHQVAGLDSCVNNPILSKISLSISTFISEATRDVAPTVVTCIKNKDSCIADSVKTISSGSQVEKVASPLSPFGNSTSETKDVVNEKDADSVKEIPDLHDNGDVPRNTQPLKFASAHDFRENSCCQSNEVGLSPSCPIYLEMLTPGGQDVIVQNVQQRTFVDPNVQHGNVPGHDAIETGIEMHKESEAPLGHDVIETGNKVHKESEETVGHDAIEIGNKVQEESEGPVTESSEKVEAVLNAPFGIGCFDACRNDSEDLVNSYGKKALEEPMDNDYGSDVSHACHGYVRVSGFKVDNDSQYEDGEVRESIEHTWEEYDGDDMEPEHVDYGSDNANLGYGAAQEVDFPICPIGLKVQDAKNEDGTADKIENELKAWSDKVGHLGTGAMGDNAKIGVRNDSSMKSISVDCVDESDAEDQTRMAESKTFRRELRSCIEGQASHDVFRNDSDSAYLNPKSERKSGYVESFGRGRYTRHSYARGRGGDHFVDSRERNRGLKHCYSPKYHGSTSFHYPGAENGSHRHLTRSGSPDVRDEDFGMCMRIKPSRDLSPSFGATLGRGRFVRYGLQVDGIRPRGRIHGSHGSLPDGLSESSFNNSHLLSRRERSFSPTERKKDSCVHRPQTKSPSRYTSRSPGSGNPCSRHRSKSPNFRPEFRMQRLRSPHHRPGILADHLGGYKPMPGSRGSPAHNVRWTGFRKDGIIPFREHGYNQRSSFLDRRLPDRFGPRDGPRDGRFKLVDSPRNFRSMRRWRFSEIDGPGRGDLRYEGNDHERGKHGYGYGPVHPVKRHGMDGPRRRFHYNVDEGFVAARNSRYRDAPGLNGSGGLKDHGRDTYSRIGDLPREYREDRGPFIHKKGKQNVDSKSFEMQEGDDTIASRPP